MILVIFTVLFVIEAIIILKIAEKYLKNSNDASHIDLTFVKGTTQGTMGLLETNEMLEFKRMQLNRKSTKM